MVRFTQEQRNQRNQLRIHLTGLREQLFGKDRLPNPPVDTLYHAVQIPLRDRESVIVADVLLRPDNRPMENRRRGSGKHRLFVKCAKCGQWIPAGRYAQHVPHC